MTKLIHTMVRVSNLTESINFYRAALVLDIKDQYVFDDFTLTYLANPQTSFELELTYNHNQSEQYPHGNGHIAVSVEDIEQAHQRMTSLNIEASEIKTLVHNQIPLATFFFITDPDGHKIEFLQRQGRYL
ncbi:TPA: VOC family protein [Vibrio parahaemolyticus]|uniref:VOC family protein n=1 Tax=Vibrio sp. TRT 1302 TaxID=3418504 RepID=UPI003CF6A495